MADKKKIQPTNPTVPAADPKKVDGDKNDERKTANFRYRKTSSGSCRF